LYTKHDKNKNRPLPFLRLSTKSSHSFDIEMKTSRPSILIIDNDVPTLELYRRELRNEFLVYVCSNEAEALERLNTCNLKAIVLEPAISDGQGWRLFLAIQDQFKERQAIPVILCSTSDERKRGLQAGAAAFLIKPVLPAELHTTLTHIVGMYS
jgi:DNA-binding response OmpR family regulator